MSSAVSIQKPNSSASINLLTLTRQAVGRLVQDCAWPPYRTHQILRWLYKKRVRDIGHMTDLSHTERNRLASIATITPIQCDHALESADGTQKLVLRLEDGLNVECVVIPDANRLTLCLSTQVGCTLDCEFCLTGTMGLKRNLHAHEIVGQVLLVQDRLNPNQRLSSLVLMGMGESLANVEPVKEAIVRLTNATWGVGIPARRITLSTAGWASRLEEVAALGINLAVSINATTSVQRAHLMPTINRLFPLDTLLKACRDYTLSSHRRLTFEYVLLAGINDSDQDAVRLTKLLAGMWCKINLIPFNEFSGSSFRRPNDATVAQFQSILKRSGFDAFIRKSKGRDVLGACGQLGRVSYQTSRASAPPGIAC